MADFSSPNDVLRFAIDLENQMIEAYTCFAKLKECEPISSLLKLYIEEEKTHRYRLKNILNSGQFKLADEQLAGLCKSDYEIRRDCDTFNTLPEILPAIMDNEKMAFKFYYHIATLCEDQILKLLFGSLAEDESRHKLRFELALDEIQ